MACLLSGDFLHSFLDHLDPLRHLSQPLQLRLRDPRLRLSLRVPDHRHHLSDTTHMLRRDLLIKQIIRRRRKNPSRRRRLQTVVRAMGRTEILAMDS